MSQNDPTYIPSELEERALIDAGVPVGPIATFKETPAERRLREFQMKAPIVPLETKIRTIVQEELKKALDTYVFNPNTRRSSGRAKEERGGGRRNKTRGKKV